MKFIAEHIVAFIMVGFIIVIGSALLLTGSISVDVVQEGSNDMAELASSYDAQEFLGFDTGEQRSGFQVIQLIDKMETTNNPRMRAVVTTRSGSTTTYGYANETSDTYVAYEETSPLDADYILKDDYYEVTVIKSANNDIVVGYTLDCIN